MIKQQITSYINSYSFNGEIVVPSQVMTSTPQEEQLNLSYSPNFTMRVEDTYSYLNVTDKVEATFTADDTQYTAYMRVLNRAGNTVTLQYVDGLVSSDAPEPEPEPEPYFSSPTDGDTMTVTLDPDDPDYDGTYKVDIIVVDGDGNNVNLDDVYTYTTLTDTDNNGLSIGSEAEDLGQGYEETSRVYVIIPENTSGTATLTYDDGNGNSCTTTFTYDISVAQPEPEPDPLDSMLTISGPIASDSDGTYDSIVYTQETQDVYMQSAGMTYDSANDRYEFASDVQSALIKLCAPVTHTFETVTFVNLDSTYKAVFLQIGNVGYGVVTDDGDGNLIWTRTIDYDPTEGLPSFDFTQVIQQVGADMTCEEIHITMAPYVAPEPEPEPQSISISISSDSPMSVGDVYTFSVTTDSSDDVTADCSYEYDDTCLSIDGSAGTIECIALHPDGLTAFQATYTTGSGELQALQYVSTDVPSGGGGSGASSIYTWPDSFTFTGVKTSLNGDMWYGCTDNTARFSVFDDLQNDVSQDVQVYFSSMHVYDGQAEEQDIDVANDFGWSVAFDTQDILVKAPMNVCDPDYVLNGNPTLSIEVEYTDGDNVLTTSIPVTLRYIDLDDGGQHTIEFDESNYSCEKTIDGNDVTYNDAPFNIVVDGNESPTVSGAFTKSGMSNAVDVVDITEQDPDLGLYTTVGYAFRAVYATPISTALTVSATYGSTTIQASVHLTVTEVAPQ